MAKKKPARKAAKKVVKQAAKGAGRKAAGRASPAKKAGGKAGASVKVRTKPINVGRLDLLWRELEGLSKDLRNKGLVDFADRAGDAQDVVKQVWQDLIGGKGNGPDPGKMIVVQQ